jgi:hypothetical protein
MIRHWTTSNFKGGKEFFVTDLWKKWRDSNRKHKYNESNWITNSDGVFIASDKTDGLGDYSKVPFMSTTDKVGVMIVDISKSSTTPLKQVRLSAYDPDTGAELAYSRTEAISSTSKTLSKEYSGKKQYLSYTYSILTFTPSTTGINEFGYPIKKRVNLKVQVNSGGWKDLGVVGNKTFMKFFEIGPGSLTGGNVLPFTNETIPNYFFSAFYGLATGDLYDDSVGKRYLNYIIPTPRILDDIGTIWSDIKCGSESVLAYIIKMNNSVSYKEDSVYYNTMKVISSKTIEKAYQIYDIITTFDTERDEDYYKIQNAVSYTNWNEYNLVGWESLAGVFNPNESIRLKEFGIRSTVGTCLNVASASILPGYEETAVNTIFEFCLPAGTQNHKQPIDNVSMSIIANTFKLPFWKYKAIDEVLQIKVLRQGASGSAAEADYVQEFNVLSSNGYFQMVLELENTGVCDIVEAGVGFYCKFYV